MKTESKRLRIKEYLVFPLRHDGGSTVGMIVLRVISAFLPTAKMLLLARFVDEALRELGDGGISSASLLLIAGLLVGVLLLGKAVELLMGFLAVRFSTLVSAAHEQRLTEKKSRVRFSVLEDPESYELMCRVMDDQADRMASAFDNLMALAEGLLRMLFIAAAVVSMNPWCGLFLLLAFLAILPVARKCGSESYSAYEDATKYYKISRYLRRVLSDREHVGERTQFAYTSRIQAAWDAAQEEARLRVKAATKKNMVRSKLLTSAIALVAVLLYAGMLLPLSRGSMTPGDYVSVVTTTAQIISMLTWSFAALLEKFEENQLYAQDLEEFLALPEDRERQPAPERRFSPKTVGRIEFRNVSFRYPGCPEQVLRNLSFVMEQGHSYALVGRNGAGKTTVIKLLTGLYGSYEGEILIDGTELREIDDENRRRLFSVIYQDFARYQLSVRENLTLGCVRQPEEAEIWALVDSLDLREKLDRLPEGLETNLGCLEEIGIDFSGGEWQKIAIARAVLKHAPILIMDEPTASLDPLHEQSIFQLFGKHSRQASVSILITHRLGGIRQVDRILVLEDGAVAEQGAHAELMEKQGIYAAMYADQERWYT